MAIRRLLAVTHEMSITGAPMNLLHLLRWLEANTDIELHTLALHDGPLRHRFEQVGEVTVIRDRGLLGLASVAQRGLLQLGSTRAWKAAERARLRPQLRHLDDFDVVYLNSIGSAVVAPHLPPAPCLVSHVHELQVALRTFTPPDHLETLLHAPDAWIAASAAVRDLLVGEFERPDDRVLLHHEFIDAAGIAARRISHREIDRCRRTAGVPSDADVVVGAGTLEWRKGVDLFVQLASEVRRATRAPVHFIWVGGELRGTDWERVRADVERTGAQHVHFVGVREDPLPWFAAGSVFALTSREDPFPLVCLEAAALGRPVVTYRNGGIPELLAAAGPAAASGIVDHLDVGALAERTIGLLESRDLARAAASELRDRVLAHHDVEVAAPRLLSDITALLDARSGRSNPSPLVSMPAIPG